jgi:hypothetical protein
VRRAEVRVGREYLTRGVRTTGLFPRVTRGHVRVTAESGSGFRVVWLMRDGSERTERGLPRVLRAAQLLTEVGESRKARVRDALRPPTPGSPKPKPDPSAPRRYR